MARRAKSSKGKAEPKRAPARKSPNSEGARVRDLEKRLAESLEREKSKDHALTEALEQQTATSEILRVISTSPTDLQPVLEALARSAVRFCGAYDATLFQVDGNTYRIVAHNGPIPFPLGGRFPLGRGYVTGRSMLDRQPVHVPDLQIEAEEFPEGSAFAREQGHRTTLAVPLLREGEAIGTIQLRRIEASPFTDRQIALLKTFADQAVIAIENVRLFKELEARNRALTEGLERETATGEILRVISSSPTNIQPVLDTVVKSAARLCDAYDAQIFQREGDQLLFVAHHGPMPSGPVGEYTVPLVRGTINGRAVLEGLPVHVADMQAERDEFPEGSELARRYGHRTVLSLPLMREGVAIGTISVRRAEIRPFTERQIALLQTFADQAVIAIENVRLFTELQERNRAVTEAHAQVTEALEQQTATSEVLKVISRSTFDLQPVLDTLIENAARLCGARRGVIFRRDSNSYHGVAFYKTSPETIDFVRAHPISPGRHTITAKVALERRTIHVADVQADPGYCYVLRDEEPIRTELGVPMFRGDEIVGVIILFKVVVEPFTDKQIELVETFADQAVIAIENVRLFRELQVRNADLTKALDTQTATADILGVISRSQTDVQPVFDAILTSAVRLLRAYGGLLTRIVGNQIELVAVKGPNEAAEAGIRAQFPRALQSEGPTAQAIRDRAPVNIADYEVDPRVSEAARVTARLHGNRSWVVVPILRHAEPVGTILIARNEPGGFTDDAIALLQTFADQAVIAIENVRLFTELEARNHDLTEALEQQMATSEILQVISSSPTDLQPVFDIIAKSAAKLCGAEVSIVTRFDGEWVDVRAAFGTSKAGLDAIQRVYPMRPSGAATGARAVRDCAVAHIPDVLADPEYVVREAALASGFRAALGVPMVREGRAIGSIAVGRAEPGEFTERQIRLLGTFADQAVIAIENVRLFKELEARTADLTRSVEQLTALGEVSRSVTSTLDVETVLETVVSRARQLAGADGCLIYEYDEKTQQFHSRATDNLDPAYAEALRSAPLRKGEGVSGRAAEVREAVQVADMTQPFGYQSSVRDITIRAGYRAVLSVPLLREDEIIGSLILIRKTPGEFSPEIVDLLKTFATQSALAIQNARLFREIADKSAQLEAASRHKSEFLANMSHELRTPLNAVIGFSEVLAERMFGELNEKQEEYLRDIYASGQHLLSLINDILDLSKIEAGRMELEAADFDLPSAIDNALTLVRERATRRGITLGRAIDDRLGMLRGDERKVKQVLLNLLSNALKFTPEGGRIDVSARLQDGAVEIAVADTGVGIAPEDQEAIFEEFRQVGTADKKVEGTGLGLALSRKFIDLHGGRIWVTSEAGKGSTFTFTLPMG